MAQQVIDTTTDHGTYKGDPAKVAFEKVNANDAELYQLVTGLAAVGGDNMLINCGLPINQRGFAGGALAAGLYGYDRWKAGSGGCNVTINASTGLFTHTSGPLQQIVEAPQLAWGQPLTISVENPSGTVNVSVGGSTGTITSGSGRRGVTLTPTGSGNMTVQLTAAGVTYSRPKLERGSAPTAFAPRLQALEVALCHRYFQYVGVGASFAAGGASYVQRFPWSFPQMRGVPSITLQQISATNLATFSTDNVGSSTLRIVVQSVASGDVAAQYNIKLDAEL